MIAILTNRYAWAGAAGFVIGFLSGAKIIGIENAEAMRQLTQIIVTMNGG